MCGFAGLISSAPDVRGDLEAIASRMADAISHRGPDDVGMWTDAGAGIAFGFRRLSIIDLSPAGHQPMMSRQGEFVIVFNGEIYNHLALRAELQAVAGPRPNSCIQSGEMVTWRGHSDTETLLAGFEQWGISATLSKAVGMFAMAVWEARTNTLHLIRDRFGEKPLYYGWVGAGSAGSFVFGSELKALRQVPEFNNSVCRDALSQYMQYMYVPAPRSIYKGIYKLEPGCILSVRGAPSVLAPDRPLRPPAVHGNMEMRRWWSLGSVVETGANHMIFDEEEALSELEERLGEAVRLQSLADVPLGAFLSGGVDSSAIVSLMQQQSSRAVKTFTVGFEDAGFDESPHASAVARHLGTDHSELFVTSRETQDVIPLLPQIYDEPFADSSQVPMHILCLAAKQHVTVALSGDAGDELFGGYNRYFWGPRVWKHLAWMPFQVRRAIGAALRTVPVNGWDALSRPVNSILPATLGVTFAGDKAHKLASRLSHVRDMDDLYRSLVSEWQDPSLVVKRLSGQAPDLSCALDDSLPNRGVDQPQLRMMYLDGVSYLSDDILCKVDRAAMAASLETRVPFLDHRVVELAWRLPLHMKIRAAEGKWALRQILYKYVPREMIERPKAGFGIPVGQWLRGPLRPWAEALLKASRLDEEGYFHPEPIRQKWTEHLASVRDHTASLWAVLMFQCWLESES